MFFLVIYPELFLCIVNFIDNLNADEFQIQISQTVYFVSFPLKLLCIYFEKLHLYSRKVTIWDFLG